MTWCPIISVVKYFGKIRDGPIAPNHENVTYLSASIGKDLSISSHSKVKSNCQERFGRPVYYNFLLSIVFSSRDIVLITPMQASMSQKSTPDSSHLGLFLDVRGPSFFLHYLY